MIYIFLSILLSTLIVVTFKLFTRFGIDNLQAIIVNYIIASVLGFTLCKGFDTISIIHEQIWFPYALLVGFFLMFVFNVFAMSSQKVGIAITAVSSKMSVVIPVFLGVILYNETLGILRILGIALALVAFYLTFKTEEKTKFKRVFVVLPLILFLGTGTNDSLLNFVQRRLINNDLMFFLSSAFMVSLLMGLMYFFVKSAFKPQKIELKNIYAGVILGLLNFGSTYYFLICLGIFDSTVFFPIFNVGIVTLAALIGFFIFKEKLLKINWIGIALAVIAIVFIALTQIQH